MDEIQNIIFQGFRIKIENPIGSTREGVDKNGHKWNTVFKNPYGFFQRTEAQDGEHIDCFLGDNKFAKFAYIIHQIRPDGSYDEDKVMLGFSNANQAQQAYLAHYDRKDLFGGMTILEIEKLRSLIYKPNQKGEPIVFQKAIVNGSCPLCKAILIKSMSNGNIIKSRVVQIIGGNMFAKCGGCGHFFIVPPQILKSLFVAYQLFDKTFKIKI